MTSEARVDWPADSLGNLGEFRNGVNFSRQDFALGLPLIDVKNLYHGRYVSTENLDQLRADCVKNLQLAAVKPGDILFARSSVKASGAGQVAMVDDCPPGTVYSGFIIRFRVTAISRIFPAYLNYLLRSPHYRALLVRIASGTSIVNLSQDQLSRLSIVLPPLSEQRAIAHILGALDDKIELNRRMNGTLKAMTRALFKSWFVDFDLVRARAEGRQLVGMDAAKVALFPDEFENSELGMIPRGWRVGKLGGVARLNARNVGSDYPFDVIQYIDISSVRAGHLEGTTEYGINDAPSRARRLVAHGDTIWSTVRPNLKSYLFIHQPDPNLVVSTGFVVLSPITVPPSYLYAWTTTDQFVDYLAYNADGSAYPAVRADRIAAAFILVPPKPILDEFEAYAGPVYDLIAGNDRQSRTLSAIRDTLLPKLLSGQIRVKDAQGLAEEVIG